MATTSQIMDCQHLTTEYTSTSRAAYRATTRDVESFNAPSALRAEWKGVGGFPQEQVDG